MNLKKGLYKILYDNSQIDLLQEEDRGDSPDTHASHGGAKSHTQPSAPRSSALVGRTSRCAAVSASAAVARRHAKGSRSGAFVRRAECISSGFLWE